MELDINREISNKKTNEEINTFMNEVNEKLEKDKKLETSNELYNEVLKKVELAPKYKDILPDTIEQCLKDASYQGEFLYFDYNEKNKEYGFTYYEDGDAIECDKLSEKEIEHFKELGYTFYYLVDEGENMMADDTLKEWVCLEMDMRLLDMELAKNEKEKGR